MLGLLSLLSHRGTAATATPTTTLTFSATADTYVDASGATKNFGTAKTMIADASPVKIIYLRFVVSGVNGRQVQAGRLKLGVNAGGAPGGSVHKITNTTWNEATVNFNTKPAVDGPALSTLAKVNTGAVATFDLGTAITGDGTYSLAIDTTSSSAITYNSAQATSGQKPVLELTVALTNPTVSITQPPSGASFFSGDVVTLQGTARDGAGADLSAQITWSSSLAGALGRGALITTSALGQGVHAITASVVDGNGLVGSARTDVTIAPRPPANTAPLVTITAPTQGQVLTPVTPATLTATATDLEQGNLGAGITWTSDRDGALGTGATISRTLSLGMHRLTASVTDAGGLTGSATVTAFVGVVMEFTPVADVSADAALPSVNVGTSPLLRVDANAVRIAYLKFDVAGIGTSSVLGAVLRLQVDAAAGADSDSGGILRTISATSWQEDTLTYDSRPLVNGSILSSKGAVTLGQVVDFDATAAITGDGTYAFAITSNSIDEATYRSREGGPAPKLIVIVAGSPPAVTITAPADQTVAFQGTSVGFTAQATASNGANLGGTIEWSSSKDGALGTGPAVSSSSLTVGTHAITAAVTDAIGLRGQAQVTLKVRGANQPPALTINAPPAGSSVPAGTAIGLDASAVDDWDGNVTSRAQWSDSVVGSLGSGGTRTVTLREGAHLLTASVTDSDGASTNAQVAVTVTPTAPVVTINAPADGAIVLTPTSATFNGTATDATDGSLTASLRWTSDRDGLIGTGGSFSTNHLSLGTHVVTAAVTDSGGLTAQAQRTVIVRKPNNPPTIAIAAPATGTSLLTGKRALLAAVASDPEDGDLGPAIRWTSSRDGVLGTGPTLLVPSLSIGSHVLTATVTDRDGTTVSATSTVTVVASTLTFTSVADTYVDSGKTTTTFGTAKELWADNSPIKQAFLRFTVSGVGSFGVEQAHLRLTAAAVSAAPSAVGGTLNAITNTTWSEASTTYKTKPAVDGTKLGTQGAVTAGQVVDFDVLNPVRADGTYNFALTTTSSDEVVYASREATTGQPQLVLSLGQNTAPAVRITAPVTGSVVSVGLPVTFTGVATDAESGDLSSTIRWSSSRDGLFGVGASVTVGLSGGVHTITAAITDAGGKVGTTTITVNVNAVPTVTITAPASGSTYERGAAVTFSGTAADVEDGNLTSAISWTSSRDGALGTGGSITTSSLSSGSHTVTAAVTDSAGKTTTRSIAIGVNATPVLTITAPAAGTPLEPATPVTLTATATDTEDGDLGPQIAWRSSRDGVLGTGASLVVPALTSGTHTITASVTDAGGKTATATRSFVVNAAPVVTITAPAAALRVEPATPISFAATATDTEDGALAAQIVWTSSRDGALGSGATVTRSLSSGVHTITASVTDQGGKTGRATIVLTVNAMPHVTITAPAAGAFLDPGAATTLSAVATDTEDGDIAARVAWSSSRDGALGSGASLSLTTLTVGSHTLTASVTDQGGATAQATVAVVVDTAPVVTITAPVVTAELYPATPIALSATATDAEDGALTAGITWTSDRDGALGTGGDLTAAQLSSGTHTLTATVTDHAGRTGQATTTVVVNAKPVVQIIAPSADSHSDPGAPLALVATATDLEDGTITPAIGWTSSRDGALGTGGTLTVSTLSPGVHTLTASVSDATGRHASASVDVLIDAMPLVTITAPPTGTVVEPGTTIDLTATATDILDGDLGTGIAWTSSRDGALGTGPIVSTGTLTSGSHVITASAADHFGLVGHATITIVVNATPVLHVTAPTDGTIVDPGTAVGFSATATDVEDGNLGALVAWTSSRDGALGTGAQISPATLSTGSHTITAAVTDAGGKSASASLTVIVDAAPTVTITSPAAAIVTEPGIPVALAATAHDPEQGDLGAQIAWASSRDGALGSGASLSVSTLTKGSHTVTATVTDGLGRSGVASVVVLVSTAPHVTITAPPSGTVLELGATATFTATATDLEDGNLTGQLAWSSDLDGSFGTGSPVSVSTLRSGLHHITTGVTDSNGDHTQATITVVVNATPAVAITAPAAGAVVDPSAVTFGATATDAEDGNIAANLTWASSIDGPIGTGAGFTTSALHSGTHTITASATDSGGKIGTATRTVTVDAAPQIAITAPANASIFVPGAPITFAATATDPEDGTISAQVGWTSSLDGALPSGASITVGTLRSGTHLITATITDASGRAATAQIVVVINAAPAITFSTPADGALFAPGDVVHFTGQATDVEDGNLSASIMWISSRDGLLGHGTPLDVGTLHSGTHTIRASVTDHGGKTANVDRTIVVNAPPVLHITGPVNGALVVPGQPVVFTATATDTEDGNLAAAVTWTSSIDGALGAGAPLSTAALHSGTHTVTASVTDAGGRTASDTVTVVVNAAPTVQINAPAAGAVFSPGDVVTFTGIAGDPEAGDLTAAIVWSSSLDGALGIGSPLPVSTLRSGTHSITASITDGGGLVTSTQRTIIVNAAPTITVNAPAEGTVFAPGDFVHLSATANDAEDGTISALVTWTSSLDGPLGTGATLDVALTHSGAHTLTATIVDAGGKTATATRGVIVNAAPTLQITAPADASVFAPGATVTFTATATDAEDGNLGAAVTWSSSLDGALGTGTPLAVTTLRSGTHVVTATVTDHGGKIATATRTVIVNAPPVVTITGPAAAAVFSPGDLVACRATASDVEDGDLGTAIAWTSSLDGALGTGTALDVTTLRSGTHVLTAAVTDAGGRTGNAQRTIVVNAAPTIAIGTPADGTIYSPNETVHCTATANDLEQGNLGASIVWTSSLDGALGTGAVLDKGLTHSGTHTITATVTDAGGKSASATRTVVVNAAPTLQITGPADAALFSPGDIVHLTATSSDVEDGNLTAAIVWTSSLDGALGTGGTVDVSTLHSGTHVISAAITDSGGKKTTLSRTVVVNAGPVITITGPATGSNYHPTDVVPLTATATDAEDGNLGASIAWTSSINGSLGTGATRSVTTLSPGTHTITATVADSGGRTASATLTVTIGPLVVMHGTYSTGYSHSLGFDTLLDAIGGLFLAGPTNLYPFDLSGSDGVIVRGGKVAGQYDRTLSWDDMHALNNAAIAFDNAGLTVDGMRVDNVTDAIRPKKGGTFTVRNVWATYVRDDGVENDHLFDGLVDDSLFDGCYEGFSARPSPAIIASGYSGVGKVWTIQNTLMRLEPQPDPASGSADGLATNTFFKWHNWDNPATSLSPKLSLHNNIFMAERVGQAGGTRMGIPPGQLDSCSNNIIVWLGPGTFPGTLPAGGCFTVTTDRSVWDNAVADWKTRHPNVGP